MRANIEIKMNHKHGFGLHTFQLLFATRKISKEEKKLSDDRNIIKNCNHK